MLAKTYSLELERGNPATRRRVETQILHYDQQQWSAYSYRWNAAQTDADLLPSGGDTAVFDVKDPAAPGGTLSQTWRFHSRAECLRCHNAELNFTPGFNPLQLARPAPAAPDRQLAALLPAPLTPASPALVDPHRDLGSLELRARSYLHTNCSTCHRFNGGGSANLLLNLERPLTDAKLLDEKPVQGDLGLPDARVIAPGDPERSVLLYRLATEGRGHMPYLGSRLVDERGLLLVRHWIAGLEATLGTVSPAARRPRTVSAKYTVRSLNSRPAPASKLTLSGSGNTRSAPSTAVSAIAPPIMVSPTTRSPGFTPAPSGAERTTPANSAPRVNGSSGRYW